MKRIKFGILKSEIEFPCDRWVAACELFRVPFEIIEVFSYDWLERIQNGDFTHFLACPSFESTFTKIIYDERIYIVNKILNYFVYPNYDEIALHENKKYLSYWLKANNLSHPQTSVFISKEEAFGFIENCKLPIVGKTNLGAAGSGVKIFKDRNDLKQYVQKAFKIGIKRRYGPNLKMGNYYNRFFSVLKDPMLVINKFKLYNKLNSDIQKYVILQEYIPHTFEWRIVKIGDSYFGQKKLKIGEKASGSKLKDYTLPSDNLLNFVHIICEKSGFYSMAIDLFEIDDNMYLINEMQTIFGHVYDHLSEKDGKAGRLKLKNGKWIFEEGNFNNNLSYNLRMENILSLISK
jgi:glutathione synthase/RimK-type ligase-like ATP-grasp enzyme